MSRALIITKTLFSMRIVHPRALFQLGMGEGDLSHYSLFNLLVSLGLADNSRRLRLDHMILKFFLFSIHYFHPIQTPLFQELTGQTDKNSVRN